MRIKPTLAVAALVLATSMTQGCMRNSWKTDLKPVRASYEERASWFIFGLVPTKEYNTDEFCPDGKVAKVATKTTFGNYLAAAFTFQLWTPRKLMVTCGSGAKKTAAADTVEGDTVVTRGATAVEGGAL